MLVHIQLLQNGLYNRGNRHGGRAQHLCTLPWARSAKREVGFDAKDCGVKSRTTLQPHLGPYPCTMTEPRTLCASKTWLNRTVTREACMVSYQPLLGL